MPRSHPHGIYIYRLVLRVGRHVGTSPYNRITCIARRTTRYVRKRHLLLCRSVCCCAVRHESLAYSVQRTVPNDLIRIPHPCAIKTWETIRTLPTWCEREASLSGQAVVRRVLPSFPRYLPSFLSYIWFRIPTARPFPSYVCRLVNSRVGDGQRPRIMCNQYVVILRIHYISADIRTWTQTVLRVSLSVTDEPFRRGAV